MSIYRRDDKEDPKMRTWESVKIINDEDFTGASSIEVQLYDLTLQHSLLASGPSIIIPFASRAALWCLIFLVELLTKCSR